MSKLNLKKPSIPETNNFAFWAIGLTVVAIAIFVGVQHGRKNSRPGKILEFPNKPSGNPGDETK